MERVSLSTTEAQKLAAYEALEYVGDRCKNCKFPTPSDTKYLTKCGECKAVVFCNRPWCTDETFAQCSSCYTFFCPDHIDDCHKEGCTKKICTKCKAHRSICTRSDCRNEYTCGVHFTPVKRYLLSDSIPTGATACSQCVIAYTADAALSGCHECWNTYFDQHGVDRCETCHKTICPHDNVGSCHHQADKRQRTS